jgi:hypothetical protein
LYEIPYTLSYQLNEGFAPKACPQIDEPIKQTGSYEPEATQESTPSPVMNYSTLVFTIMLAAVLVIAAWIVRRTQRQKN